MAFIEPNNVQYGIAELPARLYGGAVYSHERINNQALESQLRFIPLQNTCAFRRRELLFPRSSTVAVPICRIPAADYNVEINRLKRIEADLYLRPEYHTLEHHRNLLTGEATSEEAVRLWFVDDNSTRTSLQDISVQFDIPADPHLPIRVNRDSNPWAHSSNVDLTSAAIELRPFNQQEQTGKIFIRTEADLKLYDANLQQLSSVYKWPIRNFERIAYMDEIAITTNDGMVFYGQIGSEDFTRIKANEKIVTIATTDSPAELLLASKENVLRTDIRVHSSTWDKVFSLNKETWDLVCPLGESAVEYLKDRERIWHLNNVSPQTETYFVTTTQRIYVFDRRMLNLPLFYMNHFNFNGGEFVQTFLGRAFFHQELEMDVYQYFSMSRFLKPCISNWAIGWNRREAVWTSMGPKCDMDTPQYTLNLCNSQPHLPHIPDKVRDQLPEVTRAIHYQHFPETLRPNENRALLFRQMDNGQMWFESINFSKPKAYCMHEGVEKEPEATRRSIEEIIQFYSENVPISAFWEFVDDTEINSFKDCLKTHDYKKLMGNMEPKTDEWKPIVDEDVSYIELDDVAVFTRSSDVFEYEPLAPPATEPFDEKYVYSKIIIDMAKKVERLMEDDEGPNFKPDPRAEELADEHVENEQLEYEEGTRPNSALDVKEGPSHYADTKKDEDWFQQFTYE